MRMLKAGGSTSRGFTFIEITMVLFIMGLFLTLSVPRLISFVSSGELASSVSKLSVYIEHVRDLSMYRQEILILHCKLDNGTFRVTRSDGTVDNKSLLRPVTLSESVKIIDIVLNGEEKIIDGEARIVFYPGGKANPSFIHLRGKEDEEITLEISYLSRNVKQHKGYIEAN